MNHGETGSRNHHAVSSANALEAVPKTDFDVRQLFSRFEAFNFDSDPKFQAGLSKIINKTNMGNGRENSTELLKIKSFYYSKNVEPLDFSAYMDWKKSQGTCETGTSKTDNRCRAGEGTPDPQTPLTQHHDVDSVTAQDGASESVCESSEYSLCQDDQTEDSPCFGDPQKGENPASDRQSSSAPCQTTTSLPEKASVIRVDDTVSVTAASVTAHTGKAMIQRDTQTATDRSPAYADMNQTGTDIHQDIPIQNPSGEDGVQVCKDNDQNATCRTDSSADSAADHDAGQELTFAQIAELIQSGKPIPGLAQVEVLPTNAAPTPSRLHRAKKPWEE